MYDGNRSWCSVTASRDEVGKRREGPLVYLWPSYVHVWQKPSQYYKEISLQLKLKKKKNPTQDVAGSNLLITGSPQLYLSVVKRYSPSEIGLLRYLGTQASLRRAS